MKQRIFVAVVIVCAILAFIWDANLTRMAQNMIGVMPDRIVFSGLDIESPDDWIVMYSRGTGSRYDDKLYGIIPTNRFNEYSEPELIIFEVIGGGVIEITKLDDIQENKYHDIVSSNKCKHLSLGEPESVACAILGIPEESIIKFWYGNTNVFVIPNKKIVISASSEIQLNYLLRIINKRVTGSSE